MRAQTAIRTTPMAIVLVAAACLSACATKPIAPPPAPPVASGPTDEERAAAERAAAERAAAERAAAERAAALAALPKPGSAQDLIVNVGDRVYFDLDSFTIRSDASPILNAQAAWLLRYTTVQVRIEGNCDERGTREYNLALGSRRANALRDYLVSRGVPSSRIATLSYGKERPLALGSDEESYARNRNGQTIVVSGAR